MSTDLLALMQVVDGAFPTGAFAHSLGLETYVQAGTVHDGASFGEFLRTSLHLGVGASDAIALSVAHRAARNGDWGAVREADELLTAMTFTALGVRRHFSGVKSSSPKSSGSKSPGSKR